MAGRKARTCNRRMLPAHAQKRAVSPAVRADIVTESPQMGRDSGRSRGYMISRISAAALSIMLTAPAIVRYPATTVDAAGGEIKATRLTQNPLITLRSSASLGDNINGPAVVRAPSWVEPPLGRYYMYF